MYHFVKNNTELAISRDSISICGVGGPGFENWNASNCRKPCLPVPPIILHFSMKKMNPKRPILILYSKFIFSILSLNVSKMFAITNPKSNFLFWESGGSRVIRLTIWAGGSYPRNGRPLIKKKLLTSETDDSTTSLGNGWETGCHRCKK